MSHLSSIALLVIILFFLAIFAIAAYYTRRAGESTGRACREGYPPGDTAAFLG